MTAALDHLDQVSIFGRSSVAFFLILALDWAFSAVHAYGEWRGEEAPLWRVLSAWCDRGCGRCGRSGPPGGARLGFGGSRCRRGRKSDVATRGGCRHSLACALHRMRTNTYWALGETRREAP